MTCLLRFVHTSEHNYAKKLNTHKNQQHGCSSITQSHQFRLDINDKKTVKLSRCNIQYMHNETDST